MAGRSIDRPALFWNFGFILFAFRVDAHFH
jgi:hypothetical protein